MTERQLLPVLPLRALVPMPGQIIPVEVGRKASIRAVNTAQDDDRKILLVPQVDPDVRDPGPEQLFDIGVVGEIAQLISHSASHLTAIIRLDERVRIDDYVEGMSYLAAHVEPLATVVRDGDDETAALMKRLIDSLAPILAQQADDDDHIDVLDAPDPDDLVHLALQHLELSREELLALLAETDPLQRLEEVVPQVERMREVVRVGAGIREELMEETSVSAREQVLRDRAKAIRAELGEESDEALLDEYRDKIRESKMPDEAREQAMTELRRMHNMARESPQFNVSQTYVDRLLEVPWGEITEDTLDVTAARALLDADHAGLEKVKKRILEFIAVRKLAPDKQGPILCLVGPPGVGKTSLGRAIAQALGREYVRAALGGVRDESEIRGHRRTYIGALPGRIVSNLMKAGTMNPVFVLDEVDKLGADHRGDPTSALLEVLDPEQNCEFVDHYMEVPVDLSKVMFLATANQLETIPDPLRDRMEIIHVPSYTRMEKKVIATEHLMPKQLVEHGLGKEALVITDEAIERLIARYTREAGVRNLEREIGALCRAAAVEIATGNTEKIEVDADTLEELLGPEKFAEDYAAMEPEVGLSTGLAWTPTGGDILFIEAREMPGKGNLKLTGMLGDVMRESVMASLSWVRANSERFELDSERFQKHDIHVHLPAGAIRKDGPSAGVALTTALVSLLTGRPVRHDVAITGEATLRGKVLPVGGIKEKVLAAHRAGITTVVLPSRNEKDLVDIPENVREELDIHLVDHIDEALEIALADTSRERPDEVPPIPPPPTGRGGSDQPSASA